MNDNHIIRVIIQGYNNLSGVIKKAVDDSTPQLDKLNGRLRKSKTEADRTGSAYQKMANDINKEGSKLDEAGVKIDKLGAKLKKFREGTAIGRGFALGKSISADDDTELNKRIEAAKRFREIRGREIQADQTKEFAAIDKAAGRQKALNEDITRQQRLAADERIKKLKDESAVRQAAINKEISAAKELKKVNSLDPAELSKLNDVIKKHSDAIKEEDKAFRDQTESIKRESKQEIKDLDDRRRALRQAGKEHNADAKRPGRSPLDIKGDKQLAEAAYARARERKIEIYDAEIARDKALKAAREESEKRISAANKEIDAAKAKIEAGKPSLKDVAIAEKLEAEAKQNLRDEKNNLEQRVKTVNFEHNQGIKARAEAVNNAVKADKNRIRDVANAARAAIPGKPGLPDVIKDFHIDRNNDIAALQGVEKAAAKAAFAVADFKRGINGGRRDLAAFRGEAGANQSTVARLGAEFGKASKDVGKLVNIRWNLILGAIQTLGTVIVEVGANLISLASSAIYAGAALGGAFIAGAAQAIPVIGLLAATYHELQNAIKVVQLRQSARNSAGQDAIAQAKAQRAAVQGLADAHYSLKQAQQSVLDSNIGLRNSHERVGDALRGEKQSIIDLATARRNATRGLVDSAFAERDAQLSLRDAELGVLDAKQKLRLFERQNGRDGSGLKDAQAAVQEAQQRLATAKAEGDTAQVAAATNQLSLASQNLSSIQDTRSSVAIEHKQLILGVSQAQQKAKEARVANKRAIQDNARVQSLGVEKDPGVVSAINARRSATREYRNAIEGVAAAERSRRDAEHSVAIALRGIRNAQIEVSQASIKMSAAQRNAQREFNKLSLPERQFVKAVERLIKSYKKLVRPLTDIITQAFTRLINTVVGILKDPKIQKALHGLAGAIGKAIDRFGSFLSNPETKKQLTFFITEATKNLPKIVDLFLHIFRILGNIAQVAAPIFSTLLGGADGLLSRAEKWTRPGEQRRAPHDPRLARLEPVGRTTPDKVTQDESPLAKFLGVAAKNLNSWLHLIGAITRFFAYLFGGAQASGNSLIVSLTKAFNHWANWLRDNPKKVHKFFEDARSALGQLGKVIGKLAVGLLKAFSSKDAQAYTEFILTVVVPAILLMLGVVQKVTGAFVALTKIPVVGGIFKFVATFGIATALLLKLFPILKYLKAIKAVGSALGYAIGFMYRFVIVAREVGIAEALMALPLSVWVIAIGAVILAIILILRHFHLLHPAIKLIENAFRSAFNWIKDHWKLLVAIILGPLGLVIDAVVTHWRTLKHIFEVGFKFIAGVMIKIGKTIFDNFVGGFKQIARWAVSIGSWLSRHVFSPFHGRVTTEIGKIAKSIFEGFIDGFKQIANWFKGIGGFLSHHVISPILKFFGIHSPSTLMFKIGMQVVNGFLNAIKKIPHLVKEALKSLGGILKDAAKHAINAAKNAVEAPGKALGGAIFDAIHGGGGKEQPKNLQVVAKTMIGEYRRLREKGVPREQAIKDERKRHPGLPVHDYDVFANAAGYAVGGVVRPRAFGGGGIPSLAGVSNATKNSKGAIPIIAHVGEWILNKAQQAKISAKLGIPLRDLANFIFGSNRSGTPSGTQFLDPNDTENFKLHESNDENNRPVTFIEFKDGTYGQISNRAADRVRASGGTWFPGYARRAARLHGGFFKDPTAARVAARIGGLRSDAFDRRFSMGGIVPAYASGGVVRSPSGSSQQRGGNTVHQNFRVNVQGDTDWNYAMKLGAIHAQESY